ncbi:hypothetical protein [Streptomyces youssoufiensis]
MTGPDHFREAERLLAGCMSDGAVLVEDGTTEVLAMAQVHATLALAAATREAGIPRGQVLVDQCRITESAYGRQCILADLHRDGHDFGDDDA